VLRLVLDSGSGSIGCDGNQQTGAGGWAGRHQGVHWEHRQGQVRQVEEGTPWTATG